MIKIVPDITMQCKDCVYYGKFQCIEKDCRSDIRNPIKYIKVEENMVQEGWICPRCGKVNAPWVMQCSCNRNTYVLPKVGAPYYEGDQATCNIEDLIGLYLE